ncbi:hypothetical protein R1flu_017497 [Riccia fluitans]|uniref:Aminotransferase-like plant mobile domain-containing protein n=1 Tax=Riccia fluitans TaxID=41844 RepID=A0ABD1ZH53_9MARC
MADEAVGRRLPTIRLMDEDLYKPTRRTLRSRLEDSALGSSWNEIAVIFEAKHNEKEDFPSIKVIHTTFDRYNPRSYLPASVETNPNKKHVSGQQYEEILYYKDVAPYGPTYHLMTTMAELFWSHGRSNKFLTLMILAYLRSLHSHNYNWAKAFCMAFGAKFSSYNREHTSMMVTTIPVVWAPCFVHILFSLRRNLFAGTPLEERCKLPEEIPIASPEPVDYNATRPKVDYKRGRETDHPGSTKWAHAEDNECGLPSTKIDKPPNISIPVQPEPSLLIPLPISTIVTGEPGHLLSPDMQSTQELCAHLRQDITRVINSRLLPYIQAAFQRHFVATDKWKKLYEDQLSKVRELQETNDGLREQLISKDAKKSDVHALAQTEVQRELEEFKRSMTVKEKAAKEIHQQKLAQVQTELEEYKWSSEALIKRLDEEALRLREALAAKESAVQALIDAHQKEISTLKATCRNYKTTLD